MKRALLLVLALALPFASVASTVYAEEVGLREEKKIALTFDDGPHPRDTDRILSLLSAYNVKATFFVVGINAERYPEPLLRAVREGHEIGNHTYSHPKLAGQDRESFLAELMGAEKVIRDIAGVAPTLFRPPEGYRQGVISAVSKAQGYEMVLWSIDTRDWTGASAKSIENAILGKVKNGSIILCHDYVSPKGYTYEALSRVIPKLIAEGYEFVTVSELLSSE